MENTAAMDDEEFLSQENQVPPDSDSTYKQNVPIAIQSFIIIAVVST